MTLKELKERLIADDKNAMQYYKGKDSSLRRCVFIEKYDETDYAEFLKMVRKAKTFESFVDNYIDYFKETHNNSFSQGAYELVKRYKANDLWYILRGFLGDKCKKTISDIGCIKIGTKDFQACYSNGYGDGCTRYAVFDEKPYFDSWFGHQFNSFMVTSENTTGIFSYDCGNEIIEYLPKGKYFVQSYEGLVLIYKYRDIED